MDQLLYFTSNRRVVNIRRSQFNIYLVHQSEILYNNRFISKNKNRGWNHLTQTQSVYIIVLTDCNKVGRLNLKVLIFKF